MHRRKRTCKLSEELELGLSVIFDIGTVFVFSSFFASSFSFILSETFLRPSLLFARNPEGLEGNTGVAGSLADRRRVTRAAVAEGPDDMGVAVVALDGGRLVGAGGGAISSV